MNLKKTLAILLTVAQLVTLTAFSAAVGPIERELPSGGTIPEGNIGPGGTISFEDDLPGLTDPDDPDRVWVRRIELDVGQDVDLPPTEYRMITANVLPHYATDVSLRWWSDNPDIVRVVQEDEMGHVVRVETGIEQGDVWIHCVANDREQVGVDVCVHVHFDEDGLGGWEDFVSFGGHNYYRYTGRYSWTTAKRYAEELGGYLATITSEEEFNAVQRIVDRTLWVGGSDTDLDGNWEWVTEEEWVYDNWEAGEPNAADRNGSTQAYLTLGGWDDAWLCSDWVGGFIVEVDLGWIDMPDTDPLQPSVSYYEGIQNCAEDLGKTVLYEYWVDEEHSTRGFEGEENGNLCWFDYDHYYCTNNFPVIVNFELPTATTISGIVLTTGYDSLECPGRNPKHWLVAATNTPEDPDSWEIIAYGTDSFLQDWNRMSFAAPIPKTQAYKYFKFEADESVNGEVMQIGSLALLTGSNNIAEGHIVDDERDIYWTLQADGNLIFQGWGNMPDWSETDHAPWYQYNNRIYNLTFVEDCTIGHIGAYAFDGCENLYLNDDTFNGWLGGVGDYAFRGIRGGQVYLESVGWIGEYAFANSGIDHVVFPNVVYICEGAFLECHNLHGELVIPVSCSEIRYRAFEESFNGNSDENRLIIEEGEWNHDWYGDDIWDYQDYFNGTNPLWIQDTAFYACHFGGGLYLPDRVQGVGTGAFDEAFNWGDLRLSESLTYIPEGAFTNNWFNGSLEIPERVTDIGSYAFAFTHFDGALIFNEGLENISQAAFRDTHFSDDLSLPRSLKHICDEAFWDADFEHHELLLDSTNTSLEAIDRFAFHSTNLGGNLFIPASVTWIGDAAFCWAGFDGTLTFEEGIDIEVINDHAFANVNWTGGLTIPDSVTVIGNAAFDNEGDFFQRFNGELVLGSNLTEIHDRAFTCAGFSGGLEIPASVRWIGADAFRDDWFDGGLTLHDGLETIYERAFEHDDGFTGDLVIPDTVTLIGEDAFGFTGFHGGQLILGAGLEEINPRTFWMQWDNYDQSFGGVLEIPENVRVIHNSAFAFNQQITELILHDGLERIEQDAFNMGDNMDNELHGSLYIPDTVYHVDGGAFHWAEFDGSLHISDIATEFDWNCFGGDRYAFSEDLYIGGSVGEIPDHAFENWGFTGTLTLGEGIRRIGVNAFFGVPFTGDLYVPGSVWEICDGAFYQAGFNGQLELGDGINRIGVESFEAVPFTGDLVIPDSVTEIGDRAFVTRWVEYAEPYDHEWETYWDEERQEEVQRPYEQRFHPDGNRTLGTFTGTLTIGCNVENIGHEAFRGQPFSGDLYIPDSVVNIGNNAFSAVVWDGSMESVHEDPNGYGWYNDPSFTGAFEGGSLYLGTRLWNIDNCAFDGVRFTGNVDFWNNMDRIGDAAFSWSEFENVTFHGYVHILEAEAFANGGTLHSATFYSDLPASIHGNDDGGPFARVADDFVIYYNQYASGWTDDNWCGYPPYPVIPFDPAWFSVDRVDSDWSLDGVISEGEYGLVELDPSWMTIVAADDEIRSAAENLNPDFYMAWDEEYLYFATEYEPPVHSNQWDEDPGSMWYSGAVQIGIAQKCEREPERFLEIGIGRSSETGEMLYTTWMDGIETGYFPNEDDAIMTVTNGNHIVVEAKIPWNVIYPDNPEGYRDGANVGFVWSVGVEQEYSHLQLGSGITGFGKHAENFAPIALNGIPDYLQIIENPQDTSVALGDTAYFTVTAAGGAGGYTYQWWYSKNGGDSWVKVSSAAGKLQTFATSATSDKNGRLYHCVVRDAEGTEVTSEAAVLTIYEQLHIVSQPENVTVPEGQDAIFTVVAAGGSGDYSYQWQYLKNGTWTNVSSGRKQTYTTAATIAKDGRQYRCVVSDNVTEASIPSDPAVLTLGEEVVDELRIESQPQSVTVPEGQNATFTVVAAGGSGNYSYQWQYLKSGVWTKVSTAGKQATYSTTATIAKDGRQYRCIVSDNESEASVTSDPAVLTIGEEVVDELRIESQPENISVPMGQDATFTVVAAGGVGDYTYQWQYLKSGVWTNVSTAGKKSTYTTAATTAKNGRQYRCIVSDDESSIPSDPAVLTVFAEN